MAHPEVAQAVFPWVELQDIVHIPEQEEISDASPDIFEKLSITDELQMRIYWDSISSIDLSYTPHNWGLESIPTEERILPPLIPNEDAQPVTNSPVTLHQLRNLAPFVAVPEQDEANINKTNIEVHTERGVAVEKIPVPEGRRQLIEADETMILSQEIITGDKEYNPKEQPRFEVMLGLSNGRLGTRTVPPGAENSVFHRRETYYAGHYEDEQPKSSQSSEDEVSPTREIVCMPDWTNFQFHNGYELFNLDIAYDRKQITRFKQISNMREGTETDLIEWRDSFGHVTVIEATRFLSQDREHVGAIRFNVTFKNYSSDIEVATGIDATPQNVNGKLLESQEKDGIDQGNSGVFLVSKSIPSDRLVGIASNVKVSSKETLAFMQQHVVKRDEEIMQVITGRAHKGQTITFDKVVSIRSQHDDPDAVASCKAEIAALPSYDVLYEEQREAWMRRWESSYIHFEGDERAKRAQLYTNFTRYQQMQHAPRTSRETLDAKGLLGYWYHAHALWDVDLFNHVPNIYTEPEIALKHLEYRYAGLEGARRKAQTYGYTDGEAWYAWEAADDQYYPGEEVTPDVVRNPDKTTGNVYTHKAAIHINAAVTWGAWKYWEVTGDRQAFPMVAEIALDTAKFYISKIKRDYKEHHKQDLDPSNITNPLHIYNVLEPDEYHEHSKSELEKKAEAEAKKEAYEMKVGIDDGDYTNRMIIDNIRKAIQVMEMAKTDEALRNRLGLTVEDIVNMQYEYEQIANNIYVPFVDSGKTIHEPFTGYSELFPLAHQIFFPGKNEVNLEINRRHGKPDLLKTMKQDGTLLAHYLLDVRDIAQWRRDVDYQMQHNSLGSSLTLASQVIAACRAGYFAKAESLFYKAGSLDLLSKSTAEGPHMASMGGFWQALINGLLDVRIKNGELISENPYLLPGWESISFIVKIKGRPIQMTMHRSGTEIAFDNPEVELPVNIFGSRDNLNGSGHHFFPRPQQSIAAVAA